MEPITPSHDAQLIAELARHPGWAALERKVAEAETKWSERFARGALLSWIPIDQRELDYKRGMYAGMRWILKNPTRAEKALSEVDASE